MKFTPESAAEFVKERGALVKYGISYMHADELAAALNAAVEQAQRGEPVAWRWSENGAGYWFNWTADWSHHDKAKKMGFPIEYAYTAAPAYSNEQLEHHTALLRQAREAMQTTLAEQESYINLNNLGGLDNQHLRYLRETIAAIDKALGEQT